MSGDCEKLNAFNFYNSYNSWQCLAIEWRHGDCCKKIERFRLLQQLQQSIMVGDRMETRQLLLEN